MSSFNFREYLRYYEILHVIGRNKTRKQFKNFLRVLYGKKKDRACIKLKVEKRIQECAYSRANLYSFLFKQFPILGQFFYW